MSVPVLSATGFARALFTLMTAAALGFEVVLPEAGIGPKFAKKMATAAAEGLLKKHVPGEVMSAARTVDGHFGRVKDAQKIEYFTDQFREALDSTTTAGDSPAESVFHPPSVFNATQYPSAVINAAQNLFLAAALYTSPTSPVGETTAGRPINFMLSAPQHSPFFVTPNFIQAVIKEFQKIQGEGLQRKTPSPLLEEAKSFEEQLQGMQALPGSPEYQQTQAMMKVMEAAMDGLASMPPEELGAKFKTFAQVAREQSAIAQGGLRVALLEDKDERPTRRPDGRGQ